MTTEKIIAIVFLLLLAGLIFHVYRRGRKDAEMIFDSDYTALRNFIRECQVNETNEARIHYRLHDMSCQEGADREKLQVLNAEFRRKFVQPSLSDIVADHENC